MTGSHIDTQPTGGKFDGCYGVLAGLEVIRTLNDAGVQTEAPLEVAIWTNEEGSRFVPVMMGSGVFAGKFTLETALSARDAQGLSVRDELQAIGYAGADPVGGRPVDAISRRTSSRARSWSTRKVVGVVTGSLGLRWYDIIVTGMEMHAGPTPMPIRRDALLAASHLVQAVIGIANANQPHGRGTVGELHAHPGSRNVIPGQVRMTADLRHEDEATLTRMDQALRQACKDVAAAHHVEVELKDVQYFRPTPFDPDLSRQGAPGRRQPWPAGHGHRHRRRTRRGVHGLGRAHRHDLRALQGRRQPQRNRGRATAAPGSRLQRAAGRHGGARRPQRELNDMTLHTLDYWQSQAAARCARKAAPTSTAPTPMPPTARHSRPAARSTAASWPTWPPAARPMSTAPWPPPAAPSRPAPGRRWRRARQGPRCCAWPR